MTQTPSRAGSPVPAAPVVAQAGWYPHPTMPSTQAFWDGTRWTEHVAPLASAQMPVVITSEPSKTSNGVNFLGVAAAFLFPILGLIIGLTQINKKGNDGAVIIVLSVVGFFIWVSLLS